jgi:hypothetical protein
VIDILFKEVGSTDIVPTRNRVAVGMFFMFSGYHKQRAAPSCAGRRANSPARCGAQDLVGGRRLS